MPHSVFNTQLRTGFIVKKKNVLRLDISDTCFLDDEQRLLGSGQVYTPLFNFFFFFFIFSFFFFGPSLSHKLHSLIFLLIFIVGFYSHF